MGDIEVSGGISSGSSGVVDAKVNFAATGDGVTDDTLALQAWLNTLNSNTLAQGKEGLIPGGTFISNALTCSPSTGTVMPTIQGAGADKTLIKAISGLAGDFITMSPASSKSGLVLRDLSIQVPAGIAQRALVLNNLDRASLKNVRIIGGTVGWELQTIARSVFDQCNAYNQVTTAGFEINSSGFQNSTFRDCMVRQDTGANSTTLEAGWLVTATGGGVVFEGQLCGVLREPAGTAHAMNKGLKINLAALTKIDYTFLGSQWDSITSLNGNDDVNCAAVWIKNATGIRFVECFASANATADSTINAALYLDNVENLDWTGGWISGHGVQFGTTGVSDTLVFDHPMFSSANTTGGFIKNSSNSPTNVTVRSPIWESGVTPLLSDTASWFPTILGFGSAVAPI